MARFDMVVEFPGLSGKREKFHAVGEAAGLDHLPAAVAASLSMRITQQCGIATEGVGTPEAEEKFAALVKTQESINGKMNLAGKNAMRKILDLPPLKEEKKPEGDKQQK